MSDDSSDDPGEDENPAIHGSESGPDGVVLDVEREAESRSGP